MMNNAVFSLPLGDLSIIRCVIAQLSTMSLWYTKASPELQTMKSKSLLHPFIVKKYRGLTINPYQGCHHRCGYCYATYEWSPEFYDKIYSKSNAPEILESQLKSWKSESIVPVMISSATDPYQPAELKFKLTNKCVQVLQKYNIPYYVFTKSSIIFRDLELHKQYKDNCFIVWSITTCDETIKRIVEPGTPPAHSVFSVIEKFSDAGISCGVNIDPIMPLITDSPHILESILYSCLKTRVGYVLGAILRLRFDIWERMKAILNTLNIANAIKEYERIYHFKEPLKSRYNLESDQIYSKRILDYLCQRVREKGMSFDFPDLVASTWIEKSKKSSNNKSQLTLTNFM
jgi:DNA repair photolyase